jgi:hypothetical protein
MRATLLTSRCVKRPSLARSRSPLGPQAAGAQHPRRTAASRSPILDGLEGIYAIASDRFTVSWERRARVIELVAWYILLLGWGVLLALDFYALRR